LELLIEHDPNDTGGVFLNSYNTADGHWLGDTWHLTIEDAKHQAEYQFGVLPDAWQIASN
jgi:hypothetical protein